MDETGTTYAINVLLIVYICIMNYGYLRILELRIE